MPVEHTEVAALARRARNVVAQAIVCAAFLPSGDTSSRAVGTLVDRLEPLHRLTRG